MIKLLLCDSQNVTDKATHLCGMKEENKTHPSLKPSPTTCVKLWLCCSWQNNAIYADSFHLAVTCESTFSAAVIMSSPLSFERKHLQQLESGAASFSVADLASQVSWECHHSLSFLTALCKQLRPSNEQGNEKHWTQHTTKTSRWLVAKTATSLHKYEEMWSVPKTLQAAFSQSPNKIWFIIREELQNYSKAFIYLFIYF